MSDWHRTVYGAGPRSQSMYGNVELSEILEQKLYEYRWVGHYDRRSTVETNGVDPIEVFEGLPDDPTLIEYCGYVLDYTYEEDGDVEGS